MNQSIGYVGDSIDFNLLSRPPLANLLLIVRLIVYVEQYPIISSAIISCRGRPLGPILRRPSIPIAPLHSSLDLTLFHSSLDFLLALLQQLLLILFVHLLFNSVYCLIIFFLKLEEHLIGVRSR